MQYEQTTLIPSTPITTLEPPASPAAPVRRRRGTTPPPAASTRALREALDPFVDFPKLRQLAACGQDLQDALTIGEVPDDVQALILFVAELLRRSRAQGMPPAS
ncbi:MAG: hypothetical protein AB4911_22765 [Oscillochloridaceae bacterium umkhey_bin13]